MTTATMVACSRKDRTAPDASADAPPGDDASVGSAGANAAPSSSVRLSPSALASAAQKAMMRQMVGRDRCGADRPPPPDPAIVSDFAPFKAALYDLDDPLDLTIDGKYFYLPVQAPRDAGFGTTFIVRVSRASGVAETVTPVLATASPRIAMDDTHLYVADKKEIVRFAIAGMPKGKAEAVARVASGSGVRSIVARKGSVFWSDWQDRAVWGRGPTSEARRIAHGDGQALPMGLAIDGTHVYWGDTSAAVRRAPIGGGAVETATAWCGRAAARSSP